MIIFSEKLSPRLKYIIDTLFSSHFPGYGLTDSEQEFFSAEGPRINYSTKVFPGEVLQITPVELLFREGICKQNLQPGEWNNLKTFFLSPGDIPFDIFSASFYLISRYEEYLPHKRDMYGRFDHTESIAFKENFINLPLVNLWMNELFKTLKQKFPDLIVHPGHFRFVPTYDIDIAYRVQGKSFFSRLASAVRQAVKFEKPFLSIKNKRDPFDVYEWLNLLHSKHRLEPVYFFLLAKKRSRYDKNLSPGSKSLRRLIREISQVNKCGIHPSWQSYHSIEVLRKEIDTMHEIMHQPINRSRQHYIRFTLPQTFRSLIQAGITEEYSMGYGSINGFRASYAKPFYWYDLIKDEKTQLLLHPFCFMEANSIFEQHLSAEQAATELQHYLEIIKQVNGELVTVFHNHFLAEEPRWMPWREMYNRFLEKNFLELDSDVNN